MSNYYYQNGRLQLLVGKTISELWLHESNCGGYIKCSDGSMFELDCVADCCANSYIWSITNIEALLGHQIMAIDVKDVHATYELPNEYENDITDCNFYTFATSLGQCDIELRCDNNGYYEGWIEFEQLVEWPDTKCYRLVTQDF